MAKTKINVPGDLAKFEIAAKVADVNILEKESYGSVHVAIISYKHPSQLIFLGSLLDKVEVKSVVKIEAEKIETETLKSLEKKEVKKDAKK
jgi:hypothetical protein